MMKVLIAVDGSVVRPAIVAIAGEVLAGRPADVTLLHVAAALPLGDEGQDSRVVLETFLDADLCESVMAPLAARLHEGLMQCCQLPDYEPHVVPRHLVHRGDLAAVIARCDLAQQRRDALTLLDHYVQALRQRGLDAAGVTRDSAIGDPAGVILDTAAHLGATLIVIGRHDGAMAPEAAAAAARVAAQAPCPVLVVPVESDAAAPEALGAASFLAFALD